MSKIRCLKSVVVAIAALIFGFSQIAYAIPYFEVIAQEDHPETSKENTLPKDASTDLLPKQELSEEALYQFLLAEIAGQRGDLKVALDLYLTLAKNTHDPRVAKRATEIAIYARQLELAIEAARIWVETDPESTPARQALTSLLITTQKLEETVPLLEKWLKLGKDSVGDDFMHLGRLLSRYPDKRVVLSLLQKLAQPYLSIPETHFALAQAAANAEEYELATKEVKEASRLRAGWELAALLEAQLLKQKSTKAMFDFFRAYLKKYPQSKEIRLAYARALVAEKLYSGARTEFQKLLKDFPDNAEVVFAVGLLSIQLQDYMTAETNLKHLLELDFKDRANVLLYLGQVAEEQKKWANALKWYSQVEAGEQYLTAQIRYAFVLNKQSNLSEARKHLQQVTISNNQDRAQLLLSEVQLLREEGQYKEAFEILETALQKQPNHPDLLYDYAMIAEKLNRMDILESNLQKVIQIKPDHAHAYNALGYSLADRSLRLNEAMGYIEKALKLSPEDAFIIDSMGWVHYKMGNIKEAMEYLRKAFAVRQDPEIAAHLGEVLWKAGNQGEAQKIWDDASKKTPDNEVLVNTIKRFKQ